MESNAVMENLKLVVVDQQRTSTRAEASSTALAGIPNCAKSACSGMRALSAAVRQRRQSKTVQGPKSDAEPVKAMFAAASGFSGSLLRLFDSSINHNQVLRSSAQPGWQIFPMLHRAPVPRLLPPPSEHGNQNSGNALWSQSQSLPDIKVLSSNEKVNPGHDRAAKLNKRNWLKDLRDEGTGGAASSLAKSSSLKDFANSLKDFAQSVSPSGPLDPAVEAGGGEASAEGAGVSSGPLQALRSALGDPLQQAVATAGLSSVSGHSTATTPAPDASAPAELAGHGAGLKAFIEGEASKATSSLKNLGPSLLQLGSFRSVKPNPKALLPPPLPAADTSASGKKAGLHEPAPSAPEYAPLTNTNG
jgi:hypothetical protein